MNYRAFGILIVLVWLWVNLKYIGVDKNDVVDWAFFRFPKYFKLKGMKK